MADQALKPAKELAEGLRIPFPGASDEYLAARKALLAEEIKVRRHLTRVSEQRHALPPGPVIAKDYKFKDEQGFDASLADLFGEHDTLVSYFWMYGPQRERPCPMCTNWLGAAEGNAQDIKQRVALKASGARPSAANMPSPRSAAGGTWISSRPWATIMPATWG